MSPSLLVVVHADLHLASCHDPSESYQPQSLSLSLTLQTMQPGSLSHVSMDIWSAIFSTVVEDDLQARFDAPQDHWVKRRAILDSDQWQKLVNHNVDANNLRLVCRAWMQEMDYVKRRTFRKFCVFGNKTINKESTGTTTLVPGVLYRFGEPVIWSHITILILHSHVGDARSLEQAVLMLSQLFVLEIFLEYDLMAVFWTKVLECPEHGLALRHLSTVWSPETSQLMDSDAQPNIFKLVEITFPLLHSLHVEIHDKDAGQAHTQHDITFLLRSLHTFSIEFNCPRSDMTHYDPFRWDLPSLLHFRCRLSVRPTATQFLSDIFASLGCDLCSFDYATDECGSYSPKSDWWRWFTALEEMAMYFDEIRVVNVEIPPIDHPIRRLISLSDRDFINHSRYILTSPNRYLYYDRVQLNQSPSFGWAPLEVLTSSHSCIREVIVTCDSSNLSHNWRHHILPPMRPKYKGNVHAGNTQLLHKVLNSRGERLFPHGNDLIRNEVRKKWKDRNQEVRMSVPLKQDRSTYHEPRSRSTNLTVFPTASFVLLIPRGIVGRGQRSRTITSGMGLSLSSHMG